MILRVGDGDGEALRHDGGARVVDHFEIGKVLVQPKEGALGVASPRARAVPVPDATGRREEHEGRGGLLGNQEGIHVEVKVPANERPAGGRQGSVKARSAKGCIARCLLCRRKCKARHSDGDARLEHLMLGKGTHAHAAGRWKPGLGWAAHTWREVR